VKKQPKKSCYNIYVYIEKCISAGSQTGPSDLQRGHWYSTAVQYSTVKYSTVVFGRVNLIDNKTEDRARQK
jgi:hypothetical protein